MRRPYDSPVAHLVTLHYQDHTCTMHCWTVRYTACCPPTTRVPIGQPVQTSWSCANGARLQRSSGAKTRSDRQPRCRITEQHIVARIIPCHPERRKLTRFGLLAKLDVLQLFGQGERTGGLDDVELIGRTP